MYKGEFEERVVRIDRELINENIPIPYRPLHAIQRYAKQYKCKIYIGNPNPDKDKEDRYDEYNIGNTINEWFEKKYGDKLKTDFNIGCVGLLIAGDAYKLNIPLMFCGLVEYKNGKEVRLSRIPDHQLFSINIFNFIDDITPQVVRDMSDEEKKKTYAIFNHAVQLSNLFNRKHLSSELTKSAQVDIEKAIDYLIGPNCSTGLSRWSSLQATEKVIKNALSLKKVEFPKTHNLLELMEKLYLLGFPRSDNNLIKQVQCSPAVRYGEDNSTLAEAIKAHHISIFVCNRVLLFSELSRI
ncbi:MAG: hypothetical protein PVF17_02680 [Ignavibacteria bacterium]|jgi:hypothetical protein